MMTLNYGREYGKPVVIALGFFDSMHIGHIALTERARDIAGEYGCESAIFSFAGNPDGLFGGDGTEIFVLDERKERYAAAGMDILVLANADGAFTNMTGDDFLSGLFGSLDIRGVVCGEDYRYGKGAAGGSKDLEEYCRERGVRCDVLPLIENDNGVKVSSTYVKSLLRSGKVNEVNELLSQRYSVSGIVESGRRDGRKMGIPTANISFAPNKFRLGSGVYATDAVTESGVYRAVTNVGEHPTFGDGAFNVESYLLGYDGDLYGQRVKIEFKRKLRDIIKFPDRESLSRQIRRDAEEASREE